MVFLVIFFTVQNIEIARKDIRLDGTTIGKFIAQKYAGKNVFFLQKQKLISAVQNSFPEISDVSLQKKYPDTIRVVVASYPVVFRWSCERVQKEINRKGDILQKNTSELYYVNSKGLITLPDEKEKDAFLIYEKSPCPEKIRKSDVILPVQIIEEIFKSKNTLEKVLGIPIIRAGYFREAREIHLITENETAFWIDFSSPAEEQIQKLQEAVLIEPGLKNPTEHIDLRVTGKIFYTPHQ